MQLSGFTQTGGKVTGNIENLNIESKQNTSKTKGDTKGTNLGVNLLTGTPTGNISASRTKGDRNFVDNQSTFVVGKDSNLKIGNVDNIASIIGTTDNGKIAIENYTGKNLENSDKLKTVGGSVGTSGAGFNYSNSEKEGIARNTVIGNVSINNSTGDTINRDLSKANEITKDSSTSTNVYVEDNLVKAIAKPEEFKQKVEVAKIEVDSLKNSVTKSIDNILNGDKSQDISKPERRQLEEIKEAVIRVQTAKEIETIATKDLTDPKVQAELGVEIEKFNPNDPNLSPKVKERIEDLKSKGETIVAFYDKSTGKIFLNETAKENEIRPSIAREWKIREDLKDDKGKLNVEGKVRATVAGEIAYNEVLGRTEKKPADKLNINNLASAKMNPDSEVTADVTTKDELKYRREYQDLVREYHLPTGERFELLKDGFMELGKGATTATIGTILSPSGLGVPAIGTGVSTGMEGLGKIGSSVFATDKDLGIAVNPIRETIFLGNQSNYEAVEDLIIMGTTIAAQSKYNNFLEKTAESPKKQLESLGIKAEERNIGLQVDGTTTRGLEIDKALGNNLGRTFKTIDNFKDGVATSVKSVYLDAKTYQSGMNLYYKLNKDLQAIRNFRGYELNKIIVDNQSINSRVLQLVINNQLLSEQQIKNFERLVDSANQMNIKIETIILK